MCEAHLCCSVSFAGSFAIFCWFGVFAEVGDCPEIACLCWVEWPICMDSLKHMVLIVCFGSNIRIHHCKKQGQNKNESQKKKVFQVN